MQQAMDRLQIQINILNEVSERCFGQTYGTQAPEQLEMSDEEFVKQHYPDAWLNEDSDVVGLRMFWIQTDLSEIENNSESAWADAKDRIIKSQTK